MSCIDCEMQWEPCEKHRLIEPNSYGLFQFGAPLGHAWEPPAWQFNTPDEALRQAHEDHEEPSVFAQWAGPLGVIVAIWTTIALIIHWRRR